MFFEKNKFKFYFQNQYQSLKFNLKSRHSSETNLINNHNEFIYNLPIDQDYQIIDIQNDCPICKQKRSIDDFNSCDKCQKLICFKCYYNNQYQNIICNNCKNK